MAGLVAISGWIYPGFIRVAPFRNILYAGAAGAFNDTWCGNQSCADCRMLWNKY
ncbi:MAG: hypothetical protein ABIN25_05250 [Ginsengibacter sp.]